jgi:hypothetical protein
MFPWSRLWKCGVSPCRKRCPVPRATPRRAAVLLSVENLEERTLLSLGNGGTGLPAGGLVGSVNASTRKSSALPDLQTVQPGQGAGSSGQGAGATPNIALTGPTSGGVEGAEPPPAVSSAIPPLPIPDPHGKSPKPGAQPALAVSLKPTVLVALVPVIVTEDAGTIPGALAPWRGAGLVSDSPTGTGLAPPGDGAAVANPASRTSPATPHAPPPLSATDQALPDALPAADGSSRSAAFPSIEAGTGNLAPVAPALIPGGGSRGERPRLRIEMAESAAALRRDSEERPDCQDGGAAVPPVQEATAAGELALLLVGILPAGPVVAGALRSPGWGHILAVLLAASGALLATRKSGRPSGRTGEGAPGAAPFPLTGGAGGSVIPGQEGSSGDRLR